MTATCTSALDDAEYEAFLDGFLPAPGTALAYHYPFYLRFLAGTAYPGAALRFAVARRGGRLAGVLPGLRLAGADLDVWLSLAYFGPNAGALVPGGEPDIIESLVGAALADARALGCQSMTIYTPLAADAEPYRRGLGGADFDVERVAQWLRLPEADDTSPWPRKVRHDIRRARERGVSVRDVARAGELDALWTIYRDTSEARGIPLKPRAHIDALYRTAGRHGCFLVAEHEGAIVAGLVCFFGAGVISYYLPCARPDARPLQPGLLLLDEAVRRGRAAGCRVLNFEASAAVDDPVYRFKARCGGVPVGYRIVVKLLDPNALARYRALGPDGLRRAAPFAFVVPFQALG